MKKVLLLLICFANVASAAGPASDDELTFEVQKDGGSDTYGTVQDATIKFFEEVDSAVRSLGSGGSASPQYMTNDEIHYLSGVYLHCSMKNAACPLILDAILELDVMNAKLKGSDDCKNMLGFWDRWVKNDFEKRLNYSLTKGLARFLEFKKKERPRYTRCSKTVKEEITFAGSNSEYFKKRYALDAPHSVHASKLVGYLRALKEKVDDVFLSTGAYKK